MIVYVCVCVCKFMCKYTVRARVCMEDVRARLVSYACNKRVAKADNKHSWSKPVGLVSIIVTV